MDPTFLAANPVAQTFLGLPSSDKAIAGSVSIVGAAHGTAYGDREHEGDGRQGPDAVRRAITAASIQVDHWDFDFDGPLLDGGALNVYDLGNLQTFHGANADNRRVIEAATRHVRGCGATSVLIGGDDSVAIPFMRAFDDVKALHILQIDAHLDWRDSIGDEALGYSSTMRRAAELPFVRSMTQVGLRAAGSARREEVEAARAWGSHLVTVRQARSQGMAEIAKSIPRDGEILIHIDCDALDPSFCPGVNALSPGGLTFDEVTALLAATLQNRRLAGFSIVEFNPAGDINDMTATVVGRLVCHVLGHLARQPGRHP
ncbi:arginase family protein [Lichenihabitans sp. Uapishka_5]|uniref:arginase family protein n=1 Tax=Lichenihabitans sp. Uapishka_5 TaxID=3037302 RepID=UPI0029E7D7E3|nr:arginase family protein [Lichenihabitans sp. Uapishka_5]MDX7950275.1 arginase family protein [Lichenihabitans sp. Uapishka_5]